MRILEHAIRRLTNVLDELERLKGSDFPHLDSSEALHLIEAALKDRLNDLRSRSESSDRSLLESLCYTSVSELNVYITLLGVILRSTNIRNSFEYHSPLKRILIKLIGNDARFILSSEWSYIPFTYPLSVEKLPNFAIVGLPASESGNSLTIPAAGHELGHSVWNYKHLKDKYAARVKTNIHGYIKSKKETISRIDPRFETDNIEADLFWQKTLSTPNLYALKQCEEIFCDFLGLFIFGQSYLMCFAYLLSPRTSKKRTEKYPKVRNRAKFLATASQLYGVQVPEGFVEDFAEQEPPTSSRLGQLMIDAADYSTSLLSRELSEEARAICIAAGIVQPKNSEAVSAYAKFKKTLPAANVATIADLINAGWMAYIDEELWADNPRLKSEKYMYINELVLKSIEIFEYESLTKN